MRKKNDPNDILFNFQYTYTGGFNTPLPTQLNTTIPQGPEYDSFNVTIVIKIIDDFGGMLEYIIPTPVTVQPNISLLENSTIIEQINNYDPKSRENRNLYEGDLLDASKIILSISSIFNCECNIDKNSLRVSSKNLFQVNPLIKIIKFYFKDDKTTPNFITTFGPDQNVSYFTNFDNISSLTPQYVGFEQVSLIIY